MKKKKYKNVLGLAVVVGSEVKVVRCYYQGAAHKAEARIRKMCDCKYYGRADYLVAHDFTLTGMGPERIWESTAVVYHANDVLDLVRSLGLDYVTVYFNKTQCWRAFASSNPGQLIPNLKVAMHLSKAGPEWLAKVEAARRYAEASERAEKTMGRRVHKSVSTDLRRRRKRKEAEALAAEDKDPSDAWRIERGQVKKCMLPTSGTLNYADPCIAKKPH